MALQDMSFRLLDHVRGACIAQNRERVGSAMRELVAHEFSLRAESDTSRFKDQLETHMKRVLYSTVSEGEQFIDDFVDNFTKSTLTQMLQLYPVNPRVLKMAVYFINRHFHAEKAPLLAHLKDYCSRKMNALCVLSANLHEKRAAETARTSAALTIAETQPGHTIPQAAPGALQLDDVATISAELSIHFDFSEPLTLSALLSCAVTASLKQQLFPTGDPTALRNAVACLLSALAEHVSFVAQCAATAQAGGPRRIGAEGEAVFNLPAGVRNLYFLNDAAFRGVAQALTDMDLVLSATRWAELSGKLATDIAKYLTSIVLPLLYLDLVAAAGNATTDPKVKPVHHASDVILAALDAHLITVEALCRVLSAAARPKTACYFENCKDMVGLKASVNKLMLTFVGKMLHKQYSVLETAIDLNSEEAWYKDFSTRAAVKSTAGESVAGLVASLMVGL
jgi:hypothetical protein